MRDLQNHLPGIYVNVSPSLKKQKEKKKYRMQDFVFFFFFLNSISDQRYVHSIWKDDQVAGSYSRS